MDFTLSEEHTLLRASLGQFLQQRYGFAERTAASRGDLGYRPEVWTALAEDLGVLGMTIPEAHGALGGRALEQMILMEEAGRALLLEPVCETVFQAGWLLEQAGGALAGELLGQIASGAAKLAVALGEAAAGQGRATLQATASACPPALGYKLDFRPKCAAYNEATLARLAADSRIETVVLVANFERYDHDAKGLLDGLARTADKLRDAGKTIVLTYPIPTMPNEAPRTLGLIAARGGDIAAYGAARADHAERMAGVVERLDEIAARVGGRRFLPDAMLCYDALCPGYRAGAGVLYFDAAHLSLSGARFIVGGEKGLMAMAR